MPAPEGEFAGHFDQGPNHFSFLVRAGQRESPATHLFGDVPCFQNITRESYAEASRLCFGSQARRDVLMKVLGNMAALAELYPVGRLVACPRVEHALIYPKKSWKRSACGGRDSVWSTESCHFLHGKTAAPPRLEAAIERAHTCNSYVM